MEDTQVYTPQNHVRILTAGSLFDGHDAAINIMRRILQSSGAEVIHLGHDRSAREIVQAAIQEDVQGIAITSYQGGHLEFFKYIIDLLKGNDSGQIKVFGGGGGTILPHEIEELQQYGVTRIYSPDDGREMGLQGMINEVLQNCDFNVLKDLSSLPSTLNAAPVSFRDLARLISAADLPAFVEDLKMQLNRAANSTSKVLGVTGTGGSGKSSLVDELLQRYLETFPNDRVAVVSVDPTRRRTGGALLGDRIRMNAIDPDRVFMRSLATRQHHQALSENIQVVLDLVKISGFQLIILETSGIGQSGSEVVDLSDVSLYVMTPEFGAATQLEKIDMLDFADFVALNKFDKQGASDALRDVRKQVQRNRKWFDRDLSEMPVFGTMASHFYDKGVNQLYQSVIRKLYPDIEPGKISFLDSERQPIIPPGRVRYLSEIKEGIKNYNDQVEDEARKLGDLHAFHRVEKLLKGKEDSTAVKEAIAMRREEIKNEIPAEALEQIKNWSKKQRAYQQEFFSYQVRQSEIEVRNFVDTLSGSKIPKIALPKYEGWQDLYRWLKQENVPGKFPFTAGVFPFKRRSEDPTRMFAGEGAPERTNKRFHYLSANLPAKRLSTAFDSVTLYGEDPDHRPDIYGKVGNSGVSICSLDDAKKLYSGFDLCNPATSVSMTINGPAAIICAFFMNAAIDQRCEKYIFQHGLEKQVEQKLKELYDDQGFPRPQYCGELPDSHDRLGLCLLGLTGDQVLEKAVYMQLKEEALCSVRGTVQADILKEDQAQNTCIFSTEFALRLMGDMQQYFINHRIRNFYSVSVSGYHIAEAGANPITQLAFTLANGFTYIEYYLARGMQIDDFAPNLSFFFSNGLDPEYAVIGRVARRIWAKTLKYKYGANERSQKLKYHIQTSGRSLHAQEIDFNDIRTTLQALYAIYDNCNSLHTNAYDEAITTPTEESVRRALAIQMIINQELGLAKNENPLQGSFIIEELTNLVEAAVMMEFDRLTERGGVLGAMETMYQRTKIQEEGMHYEMLKHQGDLPIVGVNTFLSSKGSPTIIPSEVIRATREEKDRQIENLRLLKKTQGDKSARALAQLKTSALKSTNLFEELMEVSKVASLGQITGAMYQVGGRYRRNM